MERYTFYPLTWEHFKNHLYVKGLIDNQVITLNVPIGTTYLFKSSESLSPEEKLDLFNEYDASKGGSSSIDNKILIVRNPVIPGTTDDETTEIEWESEIQDPVGTTPSFFQALGIQPYKPFDVLLPTPKSQEIKENQIVPSNRKTEGRELRRLFWDLEMVTARKEFVYAKYPDNHIIAVSMVYIAGGSMRKIFLYWGSYHITNPNFESYMFTSEPAMLRRFYELIIELSPDRMYTYNGDSFDIPYLIERTKLHSIVPKGITFERARIKGRFKWETVPQLNIPGVEHVDIIRVMLKFFPGLPNYKLETMGKLFLGEGKTGLPIEQMFRNFWEQSPEGMEDLAEYSVQDSVLLHKLNNVINIDGILENIANTAGVLIEDILDTYDSDLIAKMAYMVDPGSYYLADTQISNYFSNVDIGVIYKNIHIYDYTMFYTIEMSRSDNEYVYRLAEVSQDLPANLKTALYWSKYYTRFPQGTGAEILEDFVEYHNNAIEITSTLLKIQDPIDDHEVVEGFVNSEVLKLVDRYTHYLPITKVSFVARNWLGNLIKVGTKKAIKPSFKLGRDHLDEILRYLFDDVVAKPGIPNLRSIPVEDLLIDGKIKDISEYPKDSLKYQLASQYGLKINTWVPIKYYMTTQGPLLSELYKNQSIDDAWYLKELKNTRTLLKYKKS